MDALLPLSTVSLHRPIGRARCTPLLISLAGHGLLLALPLLALKAPLPALPLGFSVTLLATTMAQSPAVEATPSLSRGPIPALKSAPSQTLTAKASTTISPPSPSAPLATPPEAASSSAQPQAFLPAPNQGEPAATASVKSGLMSENYALAQYGQTLSALLANQQRYPRLAEMRGWEGEVRLRLRIARKGALVDVQISRSSGYDILDRSALKLVQDSPLPPPPANSGFSSEEILDITIPIHYRLRRS